MKTLRVGKNIATLNLDASITEIAPSTIRATEPALSHLKNCEWQQSMNIISVTVKMLMYASTFG